VKAILPVEAEVTTPEKIAGLKRGIPTLAVELAEKLYVITPTGTVVTVVWAAAGLAKAKPRAPQKATRRAG
jgi:hypothetical protein